MPGLGMVVVAVLGVLGVVVSGWVFWPAFHGPQAARQAVGTHGLAIGALLSVIMLSLVVSLPLAPALRLERGLTSYSFVVAALLTQIPMLVVVYVRLVLPGAVTWVELGLRPVRFDYWLRMGLGAGLAGLVVIDIVGLLLSRIGLQPNQLEQFAFVRSERLFPEFTLLLISAGVLAPIVEELFFRGFLFGLYRTRQPLWVAYVIPSVLFTLLHNDPTHMTVPQMAGLSVGIFLLAMMLTWLYQHTGSLYPGMLAHAVNNTTGLLLVYTLGLG